MKIKIKKDSLEERMIKYYIEEKKAFEEAVQSGYIEVYAKRNEDKFSQPVKI